jgi:hypothetical protein
MRLKLLLAGAALLIAVPVAYAALEPIGDVELVGKNGATFDPGNVETGNDDCLTADVRNEPAYTPVDDGEFDGAASDAFDGGVLMVLNGESFVDPDDQGNVTGQQIKVGPSNLSGFKVTRTDRALTRTPTMRHLISIRNSKRGKKTANVVIENDYGADTDELVHSTAERPKGAFTKGDGWAVIKEGPTGTDAIPGHGFFGPGKAKRITRVTNGIPNADGCLNVRYRVRVPGKSTAILMLFTQLTNSETDNGDETLGQAVTRAKELGKKRLSRKYLTGLGKSTKKKIVNWDLK